MWNRSYQWQAKVRIAAGLATIVGVCAALLMFSQTQPAARAREGAQELLADVLVTNDQTIEVVVPANLNARDGTLVYLEREDGTAQVAGRVVAVAPAGPGQVTLEIRLTGPLAAEQHHGGVLKGAAADLDLRDALRLLLSPDALDTEFELARNAIWPSVQANVLPALIDRLVAETVKEFSAPDQQDVELLARTMHSLRETLEPLEHELVDRLAKRAWDVVGFSGLAGGVWRSTSGASTDWLRSFTGKQAEGSIVNRPFFSAETTEQLETALQEETLAFWTEHRTAIVAALTKVAMERRSDFETAFRDRWGTLVYERAVVPAWQAGQEQVLQSVQAYASDFAARRLLTEEGGPRLLLAHILRTSLHISDDALLVLATNAEDDSRQIVYEPFIR